MDELADEVEAINSIYGENTLAGTDEGRIYVLSLPQETTTLRLRFPETYPDIPPEVLGTQSSGDHAKKGEAAHILNVFRETLGTTFVPGQVCLFDVIEEVNNVLAADPVSRPPPPESSDNHEIVETEGNDATNSLRTSSDLTPKDEEPPWTISEVVTELKSVFVARCAPVSSPSQAKTYLSHLLDSDKKVAKATHNITAWRIKADNGVTFQDCDDDGETAAGGRVLHLMQLMDLWNVMVVVTRWYGGQKLGPARFGIINGVARDAFVRAGLVREKEEKGKKGKR